jgi:hypothetical protein
MPMGEHDRHLTAGQRERLAILLLAAEFGEEDAVAF